MRFPSLTATLACSLVMLATAPAAAGEMSLGLSGHLLTSVRLNGTGPLDFVLDTCASASVLTVGTPERLGLSPLSGDRAVVLAASGNGTGSLFRIDRIEVDGRVQGPLTLAALPAPGGTQPSAGVLGVDVLSRYVAEFDVPGGHFRLHDPRIDLAATGAWRQLPFTLNAARFPVLQGTLDGRPLHVLLDTGARRTLINWAAARELGLVPGDPSLAVAEPVHGATAQRTPAAKRTFQSIVIGGLVIPAGEIIIADLPVFGPLDWSDQPAMILGMDKMRAYRFAVDYPRSRLLVAG
jgi:predicted aspartyl protease